MNNTEEIIDKFCQAELSMGYLEFYTCFSEDGEKPYDEYGLSKHLWNKFKGYNQSISRLWNALDISNRKKLINYIERK